MNKVILIDWHNFFKACEKSGIRLEAIMGEIVQMGLVNGEIQEIRLFVPSYQTVAPWRSLNALQCKYDLAVEACPVLSETIGSEIELKDAVDLKVMQWVENHLHNGVGPDSVIFVTGDGHFLISANAAKRKGKKVQFWFVDSQGVHQLIRCQEDCREISLSPSILMINKNNFLAALTRFTNHEPLFDGDRRKLEIIKRVARPDKEVGPVTDEFTTRMAGELEISQDEARELIEALMALGIARVYPVVRKIIDIDDSSPLFQMFLSNREVVVP